MAVMLAAAPSAAAEPAVNDVYVSGEGGYHTYRIPALVVSKEGTLLAFCEGRKTSRADHGDLDLVLKRSSDGGRTWDDMRLVYEEGGTEKITIGNPCPVVDRPSGRIWLPFTRDNDDVFVTSSDDDGRSWAKPTKITTAVKKPNWTWYATGPGNAIQIVRGPHKGRLVIPCDHRVKGEAPRHQRTRSHVFYSDDHGTTWELGGVTDFKMNECAVVELTDGRLMLNMRSYRGKGVRGVALSEDGGASWSPARNASVLVEPVCQASFVRYSGLKDREKSRLLFSNPASKTARERMTVRLSYDDGATWPVSKLVYEGSAAYSCLARLPDGRIGLLFERDGYSKISFTAFTLGWLADQGD